jgi:hypothetical protein
MPSPSRACPKRANREKPGQDALPDCLPVRLHSAWRGLAFFLPHTRYAWPVTGTALAHGYLDPDSLPSAAYPVLAFTRNEEIAAPDTLARDIRLLPDDSLTQGKLEGRSPGRGWFP